VKAGGYKRPTPKRLEKPFSRSPFQERRDKIIMKSDSSNLDMFFKPKSVAIVGVSRQTRKFGNVIFQNFLNDLKSTW